MHAHTQVIRLSLRAAAAARPLFALGLYCHSFIYRLFSPLLSLLWFLCSCICWPCPVPTPAAGQRVQKAAKIKKKAVCNKLNKTKTLWPPSCHFHFFVLISTVSQRGFNVPLTIHLCHVCVVCMDVSQVVQSYNKHAVIFSVQCSSFWHSDAFTLTLFEMSPF